MTPLIHCRLIDLPSVSDPRGGLTFIEGEQHVPFNVKRVYYLYDVPGAKTRGGHAHKALHQLLIPIAGSFQIHLDDGHTKQTYKLNDKQSGLYICPMVWRDIDHFSPDAVCLVLASEHYDELDYYREYKEFCQDAHKAQK